MTRIEQEAPRSLAEVNLTPRGNVHPSPSDWRDQTLYFLLPDRFSDGRENERPMYDPAHPDGCQAPDRKAWMDAGVSFQGGTLRGVIGKLDYLKGLGVTTLWIGPIWKQRADLQTYHGYGIQNFLEIDPRFGTRQDLRDLVDAAHEKGIYVLLDIIFNHTGNNFFYEHEGQPHSALPYRFEPPYPIYGWRGADGSPVSEITSLDDGVFPVEFQNLDWYNRAGSIGNWDQAGWEDPMHPDVEFRRGDFFDLKDLDLSRGDTVAAAVRVYQYWVALSDCDGFRIDTVKHIPREAVRDFCVAMREYCESIGKDNFWLLGEVAGGEYMERSYLELMGRDVDAVLDIGAARGTLISMAKGLTSPADFFGQYNPFSVLGSQRETGRFHVSVMDDHDMVGVSEKARFAAGTPLETRSEQVAHSVGIMLTTLGVPCIYYGTEQAFDGSIHNHDYEAEPQLSFDDRYVREVMFGGAFGAFRTQGCHFFNPDHPSYQRIAAIARIRNRADKVGLALRRGRQFLRDISLDDRGFHVPNAGELTAWSRIMFDTSVLIAVNTHSLEPRGAWVNVDTGFHTIGASMRLLYDGSWSHEQRLNPPDITLPIDPILERGAVRIDLPPAGMVILA